MSENVATFFELIADSHDFVDAFKKAKDQSIEFAQAFKVSADSVEASAGRMGSALQRNLAVGTLSRNEANTLLAQRLSFFGAQAGQPGMGTGAIPATGGMNLNTGLLGLTLGLGAVGGVAAGASFLTQQISQYAQHASAVLRDSEAIGMNAQELQTWQRIAQLTGLDQQSMTMDFERFARNLSDGASALKVTGLTLKDLGITSTNVGTAILQLSDYFHTHNDEAQKAAIAAALFGKSGEELIPILNQGSAAFKAYLEQLQATGSLLSNSDLIMGARAQVAIENFSNAFDAAKDRLLAAALPGFTAFFQELTSLMTSNGQLWTQIGSVISEVVSFIIGMLAGLTGTTVNLSAGASNAAGAYEGLGGAVNDAASGIDKAAGSTKGMTDAIQDQIDTLNELKRKQDEVYDAEKQALQAQLDTLHDVTDTRRRSGEDLVTYERRLEELKLQDQIKGIDKQKTAYDQQVADHIAALEREKKAVSEAGGAMGASLSSGISSGLNAGLSAADKTTVQLNQKFVDFGKTFGDTVKTWFKTMAGDPDLSKLVKNVGEILGDSLFQGMVQGLISDIPGAQKNSQSFENLKSWLFSNLPGKAAGGFVSEGAYYLHNDELVLPLSNRGRSLQLLSQAGLGGSAGITINFYGPVADESVANRVMARIDRETRRRGFNNSRGFGTG